MAEKVAFTALAEYGKKLGNFPSDTTVVFNTPVTNIGGGYDNSSGIFKAPAAGLYYFSFSYHADKGGKSGLQLHKNSELIVQGTDLSGCEHTKDNGGNSAVLELDKGDHVFVRLLAHHHVWASSQTTSFSGFKIA